MDSLCGPRRVDQINIFNREAPTPLPNTGNDGFY